MSNFLIWFIIAVVVVTFLTGPILKIIDRGLGAVEHWLSTYIEHKISSEEKKKDDH